MDVADACCYKGMKSNEYQWLSVFYVLLQSLVACLGGQFLSGVVLRMSKDYRHSRGGLPDLVVWNTSNSSYKVSSEGRNFGNLIETYTSF